MPNAQPLASSIQHPASPYNWFPEYAPVYSLEDKVCVITGATGGIGHALIRGLLLHGAKVCMVARNQASLLHLSQHLIDRFKNRITYQIADFEVEAEVQAAARAALAWQGRVDVLAHCAGVFGEGDWRDIPPSVMESVFRINTLAPFIFCQELANSLIENQGQVVFMGSSSVTTVAAQKTPYTVSKFAMKGLHESWRVEFNKLGVRTLAVYPGRTATEMQRKLHEGRGEAFEPQNLSQPEDVAGTILHLLHMPRTSEVSEFHIRPASNWNGPGRAQ